MFLIYFIYTAALAWILPVRWPIPLVTTGLNLTVAASFFLLGWADSFRRRPMLGMLRDWFVTPLMLLAYREMGWFAQPHRAFDLENAWVRWDRVLLAGARPVIEAFGPVLPGLLEISYSLVYAMAPFSLAMLYCFRRRERVDGFLVIFLFGILTAYVLFPYFPSEPPRTVFPGQDFPTWNTIFRQFNWWMLGGYGIHTSVFPSAHVSGSFSAAFGMMRVLPEKPWIGRGMLVLAALIATATVYGRYHYAADALAGLAIAVVAGFGIGGRLKAGL